MKMGKYLVLVLLALSANIAMADHHEGCKNMDKADFSMKGLDTDKDGNISKDEYVAAGQADAEKNFKHIDANGDGKLDAAEQKDVEEVLKNMHSTHKSPTTSL